MKSNAVKIILCTFFFIGGMMFARAMQVDYISFKPSVGAFSLSADGNNIVSSLLFPAYRIL